MSTWRKPAQPAGHVFITHTMGLEDIIKAFDLVLLLGPDE